MSTKLPPHLASRQAKSTGRSLPPSDVISSKTRASAKPHPGKPQAAAA
jgi:hypothetical protein